MEFTPLAVRAYRYAPPLIVPEREGRTVLVWLARTLGAVFLLAIVVATLLYVA